jgi:hypothetical protein
MDGAQIIFPNTGTYPGAPCIAFCQIIQVPSGIQKTSSHFSLLGKMDNKEKSPETLSEAKIQDVQKRLKDYCPRTLISCGRKVKFEKLDEFQVEFYKEERDEYLEDLYIEKPEEKIGDVLYLRVKHWLKNVDLTEDSDSESSSDEEDEMEFHKKNPEILEQLWDEGCRRDQEYDKFRRVVKNMGLKDHLAKLNQAPDELRKKQNWEVVQMANWKKTGEITTNYVPDPDEYTDEQVSEAKEVINKETEDFIINQMLKQVPWCDKQEVKSLLEEKNWDIFTAIQYEKRLRGDQDPTHLIKNGKIQRYNKCYFCKQEDPDHKGSNCKDNPANKKIKLSEQ